MKKEILEALKAKFTGVSDNVLGRIADKLAKTVTTAEQVKSAVEAYTWQQVIEGYGDSRATEAQQTAVHTYETKYGLKDGQKIDNGGGDNKGSQNTATGNQQQNQAGGAENIPSWAQALIDSNKKLSDELAGMKTERTVTTRKQQLSDIINKLPEALRKGYERTPVDSLTDEEFTALVGEITTEVDGIVKQTEQKGAVFSRPTMAQGGKGGELSKEQLERITQHEAIPAGDKQPF